MGALLSKWKSPIRHAQKTARATFPVLRTEKDKALKTKKPADLIDGLF